MKSLGIYIRKKNPTGLSYFVMTFAYFPWKNLLVALVDNSVTIVFQPAYCGDIRGHHNMNSSLHFSMFTLNLTMGVSNSPIFESESSLIRDISKSCGIDVYRGDNQISGLERLYEHPVDQTMIMTWQNSKNLDVVNITVPTQSILWNRGYGNPLAVYLLQPATKTCFNSALCNLGVQ